MSVNSTNRAKPVTEADCRTLGYVERLAHTVFGLEYNAPVLVHGSYFDPDDYLATLTARSTDPSSSQPQIVDLGLHSGTTREEALLGLLHSLEELAAKMSQKNAMDCWEECHKMKLRREAKEKQAEEQAAAREANAKQIEEETFMEHTGSG